MLPPPLPGPASSEAAFPGDFCWHGNRDALINLKASFFVNHYDSNTK